MVEWWRGRSEQPDPSLCARRLDRSLRFYRDVLGLASYRKFGPLDHSGTVFFRGQRFTRGLRAMLSGELLSLPSTFNSLADFTYPEQQEPVPPSEHG
jgi:hypothetical protein